MASRHRTLTAIAVRALFFVDVASALSYEEADRFVRSYMPDRDHTDLSDHFLSSNTEAALATRGDFPWGSAIPDDIFLDYVLPYSRCRLIPCCTESSVKFRRVSNFPSSRLRSSTLALLQHRIAIAQRLMRGLST